MGAVDIRKINVHRIGRWSGVLGDILSVTAGYALTAAFCGLTFMADATIYLIFLSSTLLFSELLNSYDDGFSYLTQKQRLPITVGITFVLSVCTASLINLFVSAFMLLPVWCYITFFVLSYTFLLCVRFALLEALIRIRRAQSLLILYYPGCPDKFLNKLRKNAEEIGTVEFYMLSPDEEDGVEQRIDACDRLLLLENIPGDVRDKYILYSLQKQKNIQVIPTVENLSFLGGQIKHIGDTPVISLKNAHLMLFERIVKRGFDFVGALAGLIILSPVFAAIAIAIKLDTPGSVFYRQERYTINKKRFDIIKFRTMVEDAESMGVRLATENDDRITKVGHFLRACRLDELPQLINILTGEMSFVGPRPERPVYADRYSVMVKNYDVRYLVKAGLTGYAQIYGQYNTKVSDKVLFDSIYINNFSLWLDLKLIVSTMMIMFVKESTEGVDEDMAAVPQTRQASHKRDALPK